MTSNLTTHTSEAKTASLDKTITRMGRKEFNSFLYDLYGCSGRNDVTADACYTSEDFYIEVFSHSPAGLIIAAHHGFVGIDHQLVDLMRPDTDSRSGSPGEVAVTFESEAA
ncbi:hypothetical protein ASG72_02110 [Bosea sp. Leaf344]|uniref:hypothetical protein n=1 Tax=Bosea sp. Leaf344 TaxID=1736346 RepID=UPI0006F6AF0E|nr:hypothetical protein [Bosea sp. Leaf344]KQU54456.1 hypothetical protein ASG72_02110 [Bosea sp. Leaf344]